jgi:benzoate-CoA ligase
MNRPLQANLAACLLDHNLARRPDKVVYLCGEDAVTYRQLADGAYRCAVWLRDQGVGHGDRVLISLVDSPVFVAAFLAANLLGAVAVPVSTALADDAYRYILEDSAASVALISPAHAELPAFAAHARLVCGERLGEFLLDFTAAPIEAAAVGEDDLAYMIYTSGSTGQPKGVPHRHADFIFSAQSYAEGIVGIGEDDRLFTASKMTFAYGLGCSLMFTLYAGASAVLNPATATPEQLLALIDRHRPSVFFAVPTIYVQLIRSFSEDRRELPMRFCGSAGERLPAFVVEAWREITGIDVVDGLGSTETNYIVISNRPGALVPGSAGSAVPGCEIRLVDDAGKDVASGESGHLLVRCASAARAYWRLPEVSAATMRADGYLRTGDVMREEGGSYYHLGRSDDMLKVGGQYISPVTLEEVLRGHPAVADCAVVACQVGGMERPAAHLVMKPGFAPGAALEKELRAHAAAQLADYMRPMKYFFHDDLPRNPSGKVQRFKLKGSVD